ncbi:putative transcription regulator with HTH domain-containing protein [Rhizobium sp. PDO1-076]|mgnify:FL=1|uniref:hypothetical protein n=1 Tax=Rhizobium sp. PDO1-076 TaxID=1125979 RepID=UPI00024E39E5|nr:hypothetical protein [Rhizobium sp. PDO1-076]EHS48923.1 putative transcription regulator with HTH domain-containing protein [Rhizobium sp. PDO1-076]
MSAIEILKDEGDYHAALQKVRRFFEQEPAAGTSDADEFDALVQLIEVYETKHYAIGAVSA